MSGLSDSSSTGDVKGDDDDTAAGSSAGCFGGISKGAGIAVYRGR